MLSVFTLLVSCPFFYPATVSEEGERRGEKKKVHQFTPRAPCSLILSHRSLPLSAFVSLFFSLSPHLCLLVCFSPLLKHKVTRRGKIEYKCRHSKKQSKFSTLFVTLIIGWLVLSIYFALSHSIFSFLSFLLSPLCLSVDPYVCFRWVFFSSLALHTLHLIALGPCYPNFEGPSGNLCLAVSRCFIKLKLTFLFLAPLPLRVSSLACLGE